VFDISELNQSKIKESLIKMYCDERVVRFPVQWRGNCYFSLATLLTANKKVSELYQEYQMQMAFLTNGTLVFEYSATDLAISI